MVDASEFGESTYDNALPWPRIAAVPHTQYGNFALLLPKLEARHAARTAPDKEFQWFTSEARRGGKESVRPFRFGWLPYFSKKSHLTDAMYMQLYQSYII